MMSVRKTMMTFPSDEEWEEIDKRARTAYWIHVQAMRLALLLAATLILFGLVFFVASHASPRRYDAWSSTCEAYVRERNVNGNGN